MTKRAPRFYAQHTDRDCTLGAAGWRIFDRKFFSPEGEVLPIARVLGRHTAYRIRDSLNKTEPSE